MNADGVPCYVMPKMKKFLESNGPWDQLVKNRNIKLVQIKDSVAFNLTENLSVMPFTVPHRDEYSETVGYRISGPEKTVVFLPDIDKWHLWEQDVEEVVQNSDVLLIDGSFFDAQKINYRDISEIPHPFISETMERLKNLPRDEKQKVHFIHFNHTNPVISENSEAVKKLGREGFKLGSFNQLIKI